MGHPDLVLHPRRAGCPIGPYEHYGICVPNLVGYYASHVFTVAPVGWIVYLGRAESRFLQPLKGRAH
ncbi:hypothetical protein SBA4_6910010 [Candidatus Sulfopaludibacter sp. SbA4]|nr:hypothetical protein SBA4_6910010 [Candidatus Sulfopaludibacter sp. SbA4]